jgi:hypothetical protein
MDEDFYIEENKPGKVILTILLFLAIIAGGIWTYYKYFPKNNIKLKDVTLELGTKVSTNISDYASGADLSNYTLDVSSVHKDKNGNADSVGEYSYKLVSSDNIKKGKLYVKDSTKPNVTIQELTVGVNEEFDPDEFVSKCDDLSLPCTTTYDNINDASLNKSVGIYNLKINISDAAGNKVTKDVVLNVSDKTTLEQIKESDFNVSYTSPKDAEWNNTFTYKFPKCLDDSSKDYEGVVADLSAKDYTIDGKTIKDRSILVAYNKYDYVIGISVKLIFDDNTIMYVTS